MLGDARSMRGRGSPVSGVFWWCTSGVTSVRVGAGADSKEGAPEGDRDALVGSTGLGLLEATGLAALE